MLNRPTLSAVGLLFVGVLSAQSPCIIASYPFSGNANDVTGNAHDGTVYGATLAIDRFGNADGAYQFDGLDDYVKLAGAWLGSNGTVTAWIHPDALSQYNPIFSRRDTTMNGTAMEMVVNTAGGQDDSRLYNGTDLRDCLGGASLYFTNSDQLIVPTIWTHVAMTADDNTVQLFINGMEVSSYGDNNMGLWFDDMCPFALSTYIGLSSRPLNTEYFIGRIDDLKVFNCALSSAQMDSLYQAEAPAPTCLLANYPFNGNASDMTGNGHDGTVYGATQAVDRFGNADSCYQFDGVDDYIDISGTWTGSNGTISAYIYLDDLDDYRPVFTQDDGDFLGNGLAMSIDCATCQDSSRLWFGFDDRECGGDLHFTVAQPKLEPGTWTHVAMSADENTTHLYINCVEIPMYLYGNNPGLWFDDLCAGPFTTLIGKSVTSDGSEFHFKGRIDDLRVYNCALSAVEIAALCDINTVTAEQTPTAEIAAYPNPTTGLLRLSNVPKNAMPQLFDATGRRIPVATLQQGSELVIDLSAYPTGLYIVRVAERSFPIVRQ